MKQVNFVINGNRGASLVRGIQTVQALEKYYLFPFPIQCVTPNNLLDIKNSILIFVGEPLSLSNGVENFMNLSKRNNILIYDVIDNFCFNHTNPIDNVEFNLNEYYKNLDVIIHTNKLSQLRLESSLPNTKHITIPHQWDIRNENTPIPNIINLSKAAYIGTVFSGLQLDFKAIEDYVDIYNEPHDINKYHSQYNIQVSYRRKNNLDFLYKPSTKLAMASSFGAILLSSNEPSVNDIVGDAYNFYVSSEEDIIEKIKYLQGISQQEFNHYRQNTLNIRNYLSPKENARRYFELIKNYI